MIALAAGLPAHGQATEPEADDSAGFFTGFWRRGTMLGDLGGLRTGLGNLGVTVNLQETSEVLGNVTGGIKQGFDYDGLTTMTLQLDTKKAFGLEGGLFNVSGLQIHGRNLSAENLSTLQTASGIAASRTTRLWELWYQQGFLDGKLDVKLGQQSIDQEFIVSQNSGLFINTMMGWPMLPSADLFAGGPAYPLSSLGIRFRAQPTGNLTALAGVFDDNPPGGPFNDDSQLRGAEKSGTKFNLGTGALIIAELQYALNQPAEGDIVRDDVHAGLPGTYKLGLWYDTAAFPDQEFDDTGLPLADPASSGNPRQRRGNLSFYAVADQMIWRPDPLGPRSLNLFARIMGAPGDRNLIDFSLNAGITLKAPLPDRDNDALGIGYGLAKVGNHAAGLDRDNNTINGAGIPVRSTEHFIEVTYQYQAAPWWLLQPDFQYVFNPGAGLQDPNNPSRRIGDAAVLGLRTTITF
jgi:porin